MSFHIGRVGMALPVALLAVSCGGSSGGPPGSGGASGAAGAASSAGMSGNATMPKSCDPTYRACECGDQGQGFMDCDADHELTCNCDAPVPQDALTHCAEPCGGNLEGDWYLNEICAPSYAKGNCTHAVYEITGTPAPSGFTFGADGQVAGNLAYASTLRLQQTRLCGRRGFTGGSDANDCAKLESSLASSFQKDGYTVTSNECTYENEACSCQSDIRASAESSGEYTVDAAANLVTFGGATLEYCVKGGILSLRQDKDSSSFTYERSRISLPFETPLLDSAQDLPVAPQPLSLATSCRGGAMDLDADTLTANCGAKLIRSGAKALYVRSLIVPKGSSLTIHGDQPVIIVAETIDVQGSVTFQRSGSTSAGLGSPGTDQGGGGGAHCTAGGNGGFWTGDTAATGAAPIGAQGLLTLGGGGGSALFTNAQDQVMGGVGGGAIALLASVSIAVSGTIDVSGADGKATGPGQFGFGAGGGAGGTIILESPKVTVANTAKLKAVGGRGGGDKGGAGSTVSTMAGQNGGTNNADTESGGGGGVGRIAIRTDSASSGISESAITPPLGACASIEKLTAR